MNDKIRKLKKQARKEVLAITDEYDVDCAPTLQELHEMVDEKFAELIIKEAMSVCRTEWVADSSAQKYGNQCAESIKHKFGVKE